MEPLEIEFEAPLGNKMKCWSCKSEIIGRRWSDGGFQVCCGMKDEEIGALRGCGMAASGWGDSIDEATKDYEETNTEVQKATV